MNINSIAGLSSSCVPQMRDEISGAVKLFLHKDIFVFISSIYLFPFWK